MALVSAQSRKGAEGERENRLDTAFKGDAQRGVNGIDFNLVMILM
jgi:hypothetical protein